MIPDYTVRRSRRRTMALEVTREGTALVRAPLRASDTDIARFVDTHRDWLATHMARRQAYLAAHPAPAPQQLEAWRQQAKAVLPGRVAYWAQRMGVQPAAVTITAARTRYGSCSGKNRLSFSLYLMDCPPAGPAGAVEKIASAPAAQRPYPYEKRGDALRHLSFVTPSTGRSRCPPAGSGTRQGRPAALRSR